MTNITQPQIDTVRRIDPATRLGHVHYTVANLDKQIDFYHNVLGFQLHWREGDSVGLGTNNGDTTRQSDLLRLTEVKSARRAHRVTGLYHTAFLIPTRWEIAQLLKNIAETRTPIQGMVNHRTHWAIYLPDTEGNGIELAWDFPKEVWPNPAQILELGNLPLEPAEVLAELQSDSSPWQGLDARTTVGHVHLHVNYLNRAEDFYHEQLGFDVIFSRADFGATFVSAGGYHHHIGLNTWKGVGTPPPPADSLGLRHFTVVLPNQSALDQVLAGVEQDPIHTDEGVLLYDPAHNGVMLTVEKLL
jgi:catechol 2,3-dioxygenase